MFHLQLTEQLSKETDARESLEESQAVLLYRIQDMEVSVEKERKQVGQAPTTSIVPFGCY